MRAPLGSSAGVAPWVQLGAGVLLLLSSGSWSSAQVWRAGLWPVSALQFPILSYTPKVLEKFWPQMFVSNNEIVLPLTPLFCSMSTEGFEDWAGDICALQAYGDSELRCTHLRGKSGVREKILRGLLAIHRCPRKPTQSQVTSLSTGWDDPQKKPQKYLSN